MKQYGGVEV